MTEKNVPAPYVVSNEPTQTVWLGAGEHPTLVFSNLQEPKLSIMKIDAETSAPIAGVVFSVQGIDVDYSADWTTGENGKYEAQIMPGSYRITETSVPAPYVVSANNVRTVALRAGSEQQLVFENLKNPLLNLTKIDALDGRTIPGTVFAVQGVDNSFSGNWTTGADGTVSERIEPGTYRITEVSVPAPYYLPENEADRVKTISLQPGDIRSLVFKDYRTPTLTIYKLDSVSGAPIEGAQFHVTYTRVSDIPDAPATYDFGTLYSDANGEIPLHEKGVKLYPGKYTVTETAPAPGFQMREPTTQSVTINGSESRSVTFYNAPLNAIIVEKYDAQTGRALPGATFRLRYLGGTSGSGGTVIGIKTTGASGSAIWTGLEAGTYIVDEISAPEGYNILRSSETVYLSNNGTQSVVTVSFENSQNGGLLIRKIDAKTKLPMAGVEFLVTDSRGAFIGTGNGKFITDADGGILIGNVTPGTTLIVRETRTLPGYILDTTPQTCVVQEGKTTTLEFRNEPDGIIIIYKKDAVTGAALSGVQFTVTTGSGELVAIADGMISSNGVYYTDSNGRITLDGLKPDTYVITETATIPGYVIERTPHTIAVKANDTQTLTVTNRPRGGLIIMKLSRQTRQPLAGAEFRIVPADESLFTDNEGLTSPNNLYVTDADGQISLSNLTPGAYVITETNAPEGYSLDSEAQTVTVRSGRTESVSFYDSELAILKILKRDAVSKQPLADAEFTVTTADGTRLGDNNGLFITDSDGTATVTDLQPNSAVIVAESSSPAGYVMNATPKSVIVRSGTVNSLVFDDEPKTTLIVHKYVSGTRNEPLAGVEFKVTDSKGNVRGMNNGVYYTDASGDFMVTGLDPGLTVTVRETKTVDGYVLDGTPQEILIKAGERQELTFWNQRKGTLIVRKLDSVTGNPIPGAEFHIAYANGNPVDANNGRISSNGRYVTDSQGEITLTDVTGTIVVTETSAPAGYLLSETPQTIRVRSDAPNSVAFEDAPSGTLVIRKFITGTANEPLSGVAFKVMYGNGKNVGPDDGVYYTDAAGEITLTGLTPGATVKAREIRTVDGFVLDGTPQDIEIQAGQTQQLTFWNARKGSLLVRKLDSLTQRPLSGVMFRITTATGEYVPNNDGRTSGNGFFTTDSAGEILLTGVTGTLVVTEFSTISGYVIDEATRSQTVVVNPDESATLVFYNAPMTSLTVQKYVTGTTMPLKGAKFFVSDSHGVGLGDSNGAFTTDENGRFVISDLIPGLNVTVKETEAPDGYALDSTPQTIRMRSGISAQTLTFYNSPKGSINVRKLDAVTEQPLAGAEFKVTSANGVPLDNDGGKISTNGIYRTDDNGQFLITKVQPGAYVITETKAPEGYILDATPLTITVNADDAQTITVKNRPKQTLTVQKFVSGTATPLSGVEFLVTDNRGKVVGSSNGEFQTDRNGRIVLNGLTPGTTITAKETKTVEGYVLDTTPQSILIKEGDAQTLTYYNAPEGGLELIKVDASDKSIRIPNTTFEVRKMDGGLVKKITTDRNGRIHTDLDEGDYYLVELEAANGYKLDPTPEYFTVKDGKTTTVTVTNVPVSGILLHKTDASTGKGLYGVTFLLYDAGNNPIGQYTTDDKGYIRIENLNAGKYAMRELENKGYVPDTQLKTVYVKSGETTLIEWKNIPVTAQIQITKKSADYNSTNGLPAGTPLEGAIFEIRDKASNLVDRVQSDSNGLAVTKPLPLGRYTIKETKAPAHYGVNENEWTAYLEHEGQIVRFEITDKSLVTGVSITKTGPKQIMNGQPVIYRFSGIANTSNVRLDSFYWCDAIPAQVRLQTVVTGTYNFPGTYKITYRVNGGEPRTLADNLSTQRNYTLAASQTALGLKSSELVTEVMFVFGQAPAGFAQVEAPALNCQAIPNILAYSFVNQADVGGNYNGQWVQGMSRWVTNVYKKPVKLPRTGY